MYTTDFLDTFILVGIFAIITVVVICIDIQYSDKIDNFILSIKNKNRKNRTNKTNNGVKNEVVENHADKIKDDCYPI